MAFVSVSLDSWNCFDSINFMARLTVALGVWLLAEEPESELGVDLSSSETTSFDVPGALLLDAQAPVRKNNTNGSLWKEPAMYFDIIDNPLLALPLSQLQTVFSVAMPQVDLH